MGLSGRCDGSGASEASRGSGLPGVQVVPGTKEAPGAPGALGARRSVASNASGTQEPDARVAPAAREVPTASRPLGGWGAWTAYVLAVAAAAGVASVVVLAHEAGAAFDPASNALGASADSAGASGVPADVLGAAWTLVLVALLCLFTGVFEEGVFRVLALDALSAACGDGPRGKARAAFASAALFGLLHVSTGDVSSVSDAASGAQAFLKPVQAGLFGLFMAALYDRTRSLWPLAGIHAAFNLLSVGPALLAGDVRQTYVTGSLPDLALLVAMTVLLVPVAVAAVASIVGATRGRGVTGGRG
ncbi:CPBP family intramembrane metalloprotease [Rubneribacter badeniensis]|uniref:CPBP family intramembrane metalloprotease n=1 Tax=Rubneribacter badeniensis TaxID=2070688 RepID=A0A2K2U5F8_9ACTN|nr:CPBP family intramembrane metalloprotease [Rubneribacter badeniensis]